MFKGIQAFNGKGSIQAGSEGKIALLQTQSVLQKGLRFFLIVCLVSLYPLYRILPIWVAWENNILENAQAIVLFGGFLISLYFAYLAARSKRNKFWLAVSPFWFILWGREINWGRVFLKPIGMEKIHGPKFPPLHSLWYGPIVKPLLVFCILLGFYLLFKYHGYHLLRQLFHQKGFPIFELTIAVLVIVLSPLAEHNYSHLFGMRNELMEEILELISYIGLFISQLDIFFQTQQENV